MELYLLCLQQGVEHSTTHLCHIFRACLARGYMPKAWRQVNVTFIPKHRKSSYTKTKAYPPISPLSFMLKKMEKLAYYGWDFGATSPTSIPICLPTREVHWNCTAPCDHIYIEEAVENREVTLGAFLDIEAAFDSTSFDIHTYIHSMDP